MVPTRPALSSFCISSFPSDQESFLQLGSQDQFPRKESEQNFWVGHVGTVDIADHHLLCISPCWWKYLQCLQGTVFP